MVYSSRPKMVMLLIQLLLHSQIFEVKNKFQAWQKCKGLSSEESQKLYILNYASRSEESEENCVKVWLKTIP